MRSVNCGMITIRAYSVVLGMNQLPWMICFIMSPRLTIMTFIILQVPKFVKFYLPCVITKQVAVMGYMLKTISCKYIPVAACLCIKDKNGDLSEISIALATMFFKIYEHVLLNRLNEHLTTSHNQFGFKRGHSTLMPANIVT